LIKRGNPFVHGSVMFRKMCIDRVGGYRIEMDRAEDYGLWLRISEHYEIAKLKEPLYLWRWSHTGISLTKMEYLEKKAELARKLAEERRKEGRDSLQAGLQEEFFRQQMREDSSCFKTEREEEAGILFLPPRSCRLLWWPVSKCQKKPLSCLETQSPRSQNLVLPACLLLKNITFLTLQRSLKKQGSSLLNNPPEAEQF